MWTNKKFGNQDFKSSYERDGKKERIFVLTGVKTKRRITFESYQAAKVLGWKKYGGKK